MYYMHQQLSDNHVVSNSESHCISTCMLVYHCARSILYFPAYKLTPVICRLHNLSSPISGCKSCTCNVQGLVCHSNPQSPDVQNETKRIVLIFSIYDNVWTIVCDKNCSMYTFQVQIPSCKSTPFNLLRVFSREGRLITGKIRQSFIFIFLFCSRM